MDMQEQGIGRHALPRDRLSRRRRLPIMLTVLAGHAILTLLLIHFAGRAVPGSPQGTLSVFSLAQPSDAAPMPVLAARPEKPRPRTKDGERNVPDEMAAAAPSTQGEACAPLDAIALALASDEPAMAALDALPPQSIGLANAIAIWTTDWNEEERPPAGSLLPLRTVIESTLAALPPACLEMPVAGPVFYPFSTAQRGYLLVFGSGEWRWAELEAQAGETATEGPEPRKPSPAERISDPF